LKFHHEHIEYFMLRLKPHISVSCAVHWV
jgi:hypothetical protein